MGQEHHRSLIKIKIKKKTVKKTGKSQKHIEDNTIQHLRRTTTHQVTCSNDKCNVVLSLVMSFTTNNWYLWSKGCLDYILHAQKTCHA